jgi:hypothetical protein
LLEFNARPAGREVLLAWQTSREINTASFQVQRSSDGLHWDSMGTVAAKGDGVYQVYDNSPLRDMNYYRLKMIDHDGRYTYSPVRQVRMGDNGAGFVIIPNPASDQAVIHFNQIISSPEIILYGPNGQLVTRTAISGNASYYTVPTRRLPAGVYTVMVSAGSNTFIGKLVVAH